MIDPTDKQTQALPLDEQPAKRKRGRPATGKAMTPAEKQRAYRERQKAQRDEKPDSHPVPYEEVVAIAQELGERCKAAEMKARVEMELGERARKRVRELEAQLAQRYEKPSKGLSYRKLTEAAFDQVRTVQKVTDTSSETAKAWSFGVYLMWQYLALTMNVQEAALQADEDKLRAMVGLKTRDQE